jgi:voltage-gated potassium channel
MNQLRSSEKAGADRSALAVLAALAFASAKDNGALAELGALKQKLRAKATRDPIDALAVTVLGGAYLFYLAERGRNPKVQSYWDALVFVSTNLSVGYADIFARTPTGQAIASAIMTFGPALSGAALDAPGAAAEPAPVDRDKALAVSSAILQKLDAILGELRSQRRTP